MDLNKCKKTAKILICIDVQNDFTTGSLGSKDAQAIVPNVLEKVKNFNGDYIIFTRDTHTNDYLYSKEGEKLPVEHCIKETEGWKLVKPLREWIDKNHFSNGIAVGIIDKPTFGSVPMYDGTANVVDRVKRVMEEKDANCVNITILGLDTDICVLSNALILKAFFYDCAEITVDSSCCAGVTPEKHEAALEVMRSCQINVI